MEKTEIEISDITDQDLFKSSILMLHNDDYNSFEFVIECLCKYLKKDAINAEQIAMIVHTKGKCDIKHGSYLELKPYHETLLENGLNSKIE
jgi:ATP-dependent Clp protease adaptor protein ClpS